MVFRKLKKAAEPLDGDNEKAIAADSAGVADAIEPSPSGASLRGLDAVNLFLAGALSSFGPTSPHYCRYGCSWPADHCSLADLPAGVGRSGTPRDHWRLPGAGDCCDQPWPGRQRRAWRATWTQSALRLDGRGGRGWSHGPHRLFPLISRDILRRRRAGAAAARCSRPHSAFRYPFWPGLAPSGSPRAERLAESTAPETLKKTRPAHIRRRRVLVPDG